MVYIEGTLINSKAEQQFHVDADDMRELMDKSFKVLSNAISSIGKFEITAFKSNTLNLDVFKQLIEMKLNQE